MATATCGEYALLSSGARLYADRHERDGDTIRLYSNGGTVELPAAQVIGFELEEFAPSAPEEPSGYRTARPAPGAPPLGQLIALAADSYGLPRELVNSVVAAESGHNPHAVSPKGAIGLMQLMPGTARELGADPSDPRQNVEAGTRYLRDLLVRYKHHPELALAAYNAGPGAVDRYRGVPPYPETRRYVSRVLRQYNRAKNPSKQLSRASSAVPFPDPF